jgi:hypothetical protein
VCHHLAAGFAQVSHGSLLSNARIAANSVPLETLLTHRPARAAAILDEFAASSGLGGAVQPRRYLWTDAFAVMTWVGLHERTGEPRFLELARRLVGQVHEVLAPRPLDDAHPTARGLRIGKPLPERAPDEPYEPELEWERDGQYFHYLTKWLNALQRMASACADERYRRWAAELAQAAHRAFAYPAGEPTRMYWKMSVDLSRPLVSSMGAHDPLDGLIEAASLGLERETSELARICVGRRWATSDPLGAGGLLIAAVRLARLVAGGREELEPLLSQVRDDAAVSVAAAASSICGPATRRLPFRELGFALGLRTIEHYVSLAESLEAFWLDPANQTTPTWRDHRDINAVTLAACLAPDGVLGKQR